MLPLNLPWFWWRRQVASTMQSGNCSRKARMAAAPRAGLIQEIQAEFQEDFAGLGFAPGVFEQGRNVWQTQRDANAREQPGLRHW